MRTVVRMKEGEVTDVKRRCGRSLSRKGVAFGVLVDAEKEEREKKKQTIENVVRRMEGENFDEVDKISERSSRGG